jgi:hypothetical protein
MLGAIIATYCWVASGSGGGGRLADSYNTDYYIQHAAAAARAGGEHGEAGDADGGAGAVLCQAQAQRTPWRMPGGRLRDVLDGHGTASRDLNH